MGIDLDYRKLENLLLTSYTKGMLDMARKRQSKRLHVSSKRDAAVIRSVQRITSELDQYTNPNNLEQALDAIDLAKIYEAVDQREQNSQQPELGYEDFVVLATLDYFKNDFFTWVNKPKCPTCSSDGDNIKPIGSSGPPPVNPDEISMVENYICTACQVKVDFPRINSPTKLLQTRKGRCGEWVNCFMLILKAVLGSEVETRYVWNAEDHVWCEYYSNKLQRWVHLDPCENVFDEPSLYSKNWGKKMSWVLGIGDNYLSDLSTKYVTETDKAITKNSVANEKTMAQFLEAHNASLLLRKWDLLHLLEMNEEERYMKLYNEVLLPQARERVSNHALATKSQNLPNGRQTGDAQWTSARGESG